MDYGANLMFFYYIIVKFKKKIVYLQEKYNNLLEL